MNERKARVCTLLLVVIMSALYISTIFIELKPEQSLYEFLRFMFFPLFCGVGVNKVASHFYAWLLTTDE